MLTSTKQYDECYILDYNSYDDLTLYEVGCHKCNPSYSFGPIIRDNYVLHYILNGTGVLYLDGKEFPVSAHQAFITPPFIPAYYKADDKNPWNYVWIHFNGQQSSSLLEKAGISREYPIFTYAESAPEMEKCITEILEKHEAEYYCIGNIYRMFQIMIDIHAPKLPLPVQNCQLNYIRNTVNYIHKKYADSIRIQDIADYYGLDRSYLSKLFKRATNFTPQEYLIFVRIDKAKMLLRSKNLSVQNIAYSVGYPDPFAFSKIFKKETGMSPSDYRRQMLELDNT